MWAESYNGNTANPTWTVTTIENLVHTGPLCVAADCMGSNRFAGDFISAIIDNSGAAHLTWMKQENGNGAISIRYQRIQSGPVSTYVPPPCGSIALPVQLNAVVSRKTHQTSPPKDFDIDLPVTGPHGIECRDGGANGNHTLVFTFASPLQNVQSATVSSGSGEVDSSNINSNDAHQYIVNLKNVTDRQTIFVTLHNVQGQDGHSSDAVSAPVDVLAGDTNGDSRVNIADTNQVKSHSGQMADDTNFRADVIFDDGRINIVDTNFVKDHAGHALP
jgi:hypothetical protein